MATVTTMKNDVNNKEDDDLFACSMMLHRWSVSNSFLSLTYKDNAGDDDDVQRIINCKKIKYKFKVLCFSGALFLSHPKQVEFCCDKLLLCIVITLSEQTVYV